MSKSQRITPSRGNVFADLELRESEELLAKAKLAAKISNIIEQRRLTQVEAARILGVAQPKVSALVRGQLAGFSTGRLLRFLNYLGRDVEIVVGRKDAAEAPGRLRVVTR